MRKIEKLKLSNLSKRELENRELKKLKGGDICSVNCGTVTPTLADSNKQWHSYFG